MANVAYAQLSLHRKRRNISWMMVVQCGGVSGALSGGAAAPLA